MGRKTAHGEHEDDRDEHLGRFAPRLYDLALGIGEVDLGAQLRAHRAGRASCVRLAYPGRHFGHSILILLFIHFVRLSILIYLKITTFILNFILKSQDF